MQQATRTPQSTAPPLAPERANGRERSRERSWTFIIGGGALVLAATRGGLLRGVALSGAGAAAIYRGAKGRWPLAGADPGPPTISATVTINRPAEELYDIWRDLESFQTLTPRVESIAAHGERSQWEASLPGGAKLKWDAEITHEERPRRIEWRSVNGPVPMTGSAEFTEPPGNRGTEVRIRMTADAPGGKLGAGLAGVLSRVPERQMRRDLVDIKRHLEAGALATTEGQPHGSRKPFGQNGRSKT